MIQTTCVRGRTAAAVLLVLAFSVCAVAALQDPVVYTEARASASTFRDRGTSYAPTYVIYADRPRSGDEARALIDELGMLEHLDEYKARAFVVGPINGSRYDAANDLKRSRSFSAAVDHRTSKMIGIGAGATFVNSVVAKYAFAVAGILTYGGTVDAGMKPSMPVPAYVHAADASVGQMYRAANGATRKMDETSAYTLYANPTPHENLQRVVISKLSDRQESLSQAFANAWTSVFSRNYRLHMSDTESYSKGFDPNDHTEPWELAPYVMYDELGVRYEAVTEELPMGPSLRYEYVPLKSLKAAPKSVPLVIMLHGNNNDARIQGESSGWVEVAAKATLILASIEWQGRKSEDTAFAPIGEAGTMMLLDRLLAKYPQIDPGRVYFTGLSAGAMNSFSYGLNNRTPNRRCRRGRGAVRPARTARRGQDSRGPRRVPADVRHCG